VRRELSRIGVAVTIKTTAGGLAAAPSKRPADIGHRLNVSDVADVADSDTWNARAFRRQTTEFCRPEIQPLAPLGL
jgi:hypothetical protein